jgi:signal transduction histidine kinase
MTFRLVGLMSLVLLVSLAAFALVMNSYQSEVMQEVTRTVSAVGKATLETFEHHQLPVGVKIVASAHGKGEGTGFQYKIITGDPSKDSPISPKPDHVQIIRLDGHDPAKEAGTLETQTTQEGYVVVRVHEVRAEPNSAGDTVLHIPAWPLPEDAQAPQDSAQGSESLAWVPDDTASSTNVVAPGVDLPHKPGDGAVFVKTARKDILLPIPTREFGDLFAGFRRRTLFLFLGIFLLGTLLSAGLAARFTRPVRRLDAGIRRLAEGDLDVRVDSKGNDEVGRLGRAFNDMAARLQSSRKRELEMRRREKLSALGRMAAGVAHDVRNPLHSIGLTLQNLQETARPHEAERRYEFDRSLAVIRDEIRRLDRLIENFLRFARSDRAARVPMDLAALARETAQLVEKEAERRGVSVRVSAEGTPAVIEGDAEAIRSSILNLVLNSFEAMPQGGSLMLSVRQAEGELRLEVIDTGRGIPKEDQEKVFEFAYTTREDGHGLGLAMVHQVVVEDHGGRVTLSSLPGEGTRVLLAFPRGSAPVAQAAS